MLHLNHLTAGQATVLNIRIQKVSSSTGLPNIYFILRFWCLPTWTK